MEMEAKEEQRENEVIPSSDESRSVGDDHHLVLSGVWIGLISQVYFKATDPFNERWQGAWMINAFWDILAYVLLCVICYLWAPSQSSQRYAYSDEMGDELDDDEAQSLCKGSPKGDISLVKQDRKEKNGESADAEIDNEKGPVD